MNFSDELILRLQCPKTKSKLTLKDNYLVSTSCNEYPIIDNVPILINNNNSLFSVDQYKAREVSRKKVSKIKSAFHKLLPKLGNNLVAEKNFKKISNTLPNNSKILIIGGASKGEGMKEIYCHDKYDIVVSDILFSEDVNLVSDAHDIPFIDETFDLVVVQAVLEHVLDPTRCVKEIYRVLKNDAIVYAEMPFMQQVHMREYDFTRYTYLGFRRLFRRFYHTESGICCGPGMALAWSYSYFLQSLSSNLFLRKFLLIFAHFTSFYLKYLDVFLIKKADSYLSASGFYFLGRKSCNTLSDKELLKLYRGGD
jgi:SAM-dependent methyltransferase